MPHPIVAEDFNAASKDQEDVGRLVPLPTQHRTPGKTPNLTGGVQGSPILGTERSPERRRHRLRQRIAPLDLLAHRHPFDDQAVPMVIVETRGGIESPQSSDVRSAGAESRRSSFRCRWHAVQGCE